MFALSAFSVGFALNRANKHSAPRTNYQGADASDLRIKAFQLILPGVRV